MNNISGRRDRRLKRKPDRVLPGGDDKIVKVEVPRKLRRKIQKTRSVGVIEEPHERTKGVDDERIRGLARNDELLIEDLRLKKYEQLLGIDHKDGEQLFREFGIDGSAFVLLL